MRITPLTIPAVLVSGLLAACASSGGTRSELVTAMPKCDHAVGTLLVEPTQCNMKVCKEYHHLLAVKAQIDQRLPPMPPAGPDSRVAHEVFQRVESYPHGPADAYLRASGDAGMLNFFDADIRLHTMLVATLRQTGCFVVTDGNDQQAGAAAPQYRLDSRLINLKTNMSIQRGRYDPLAETTKQSARIVFSVSLHQGDALADLYHKKTDLTFRRVRHADNVIVDYDWTAQQVKGFGDTALGDAATETVLHAAVFTTDKLAGPAIVRRDPLTGGAQASDSSTP